HEALCAAPGGPGPGAPRQVRQPLASRDGRGRGPRRPFRRQATATCGRADSWYGGALPGLPASPASSPPSARPARASRQRMPPWDVWMLWTAAAAGVVLRLWRLPRQVLLFDEWHAVRGALALPLGRILTTFQMPDYSIPLTALY